MSKMLSILLKLTVIVFSFSTYAHEQSIARISVIKDNNKESHSYQFQWQVAVKDLNRVLALDSNGDRKIVGDEIIKNQSKIKQVLAAHLLFLSKDKQCYFELTEEKKNYTDITFKQLSNGVAIVISDNLLCDDKLHSIEYQFLKDVDSLHVAQLSFESGSAKSVHLFSADNELIAVESEDQIESVSNGFKGFVVQGIWHIWIGLDHLLFLIILLFSSALPIVANLKTNSAYIPTILSKPFYKRLLLLVTTFTIAHSVTLILASINLISIPSWLIESIIAASVVWGAALILAGKTGIGNATVFNFGLIHGLGFASVLADLTGNIADNLLLLLAFNLGVELGQIVFLLFISLIVLLLTKRIEISKIGKIAAIPILFISVNWLIERLFEIQLLGI